MVLEPPLTRQPEGAAIPAHGAPPPGVALACRSVTKRFGGLTALSGVSLEVTSGCIFGVIGPNGSGKSTLLGVLSGFHRPTEGRVFLGARDVTGWRPERIARAGLVRTFQLSRPFSRLTVWENLLVAAPGRLSEQWWRALMTPARAWAPPGVARRARELLELTRLSHLAGELASNLSYGQQKLLSLACAVMSGARLLLLDEPMAGVNPAAGRVIRDAIREWNRQGLTFVVVEHDMGFVMEMCDEVAVLDAGTVVARGAPGEVRRDPKVMAAYLGS